MLVPEIEPRYSNP